jgi:hypothetical protein
MGIAGSGDGGWSSWGSLVLAVGCLDARLWDTRGVESNLHQGGRLGAIWLSFKLLGGLLLRPLMIRPRLPIGPPPHTTSRVPL